MTEGQTAALIGAALAIVFGAIGGYLFYSGLEHRHLAKQSELWPTTGGTVLASAVTKRTTRDRKRHTTSTRYTPEMRAT